MFDVTYVNRHNKVVTRRCESVEDSGVGFGFVKLSGFVFKTAGGLTIPGEEEVANVKAIHVAPHRLIEVQELDEAVLPLDRPKGTVLALADRTD